MSSLRERLSTVAHIVHKAAGCLIFRHSYDPLSVLDSIRRKEFLTNNKVTVIAVSDSQKRPAKAKYLTDYQTTR